MISGWSWSGVIAVIRQVHTGVADASRGAGIEVGRLEAGGHVFPDADELVRCVHEYVVDDISSIQANAVTAPHEAGPEHHDRLSALCDAIEILGAPKRLRAGK